VIRLYGFSPPTLSLGRFQKAKGQISVQKLARDGVTLVRRPTGGHAVLHDDELTYSVALSKDGSPRKSTLPESITARSLQLWLISSTMFRASEAVVTFMTRTR
jgi:lipoate-protein ligase A